MATVTHDGPVLKIANSNTFMEICSLPKHMIFFCRSITVRFMTIRRNP